MFLWWSSGFKSKMAVWYIEQKQSLAINDERVPSLSATGTLVEICRRNSSNILI
jgi:hypothetical protein